jgi:hypothetical protein
MKPEASNNYESARWLRVCNGRLSCRHMGCHCCRRSSASSVWGAAEGCRSRHSRASEGGGSTSSMHPGCRGTEGGYIALGASLHARGIKFRRRRTRERDAQSQVSMHRRNLNPRLGARSRIRATGPCWQVRAGRWRGLWAPADPTNDGATIHRSAACVGCWGAPHRPGLGFQTQRAQPTPARTASARPERSHTTARPRSQPCMFFPVGGRIASGSLLSSWP